VSAAACPACWGTAWVRGAPRSTAVVADAWARQDAFRAVAPGEVLRRVAADVGDEHLRFDRCTGCGVERAEPPRCWSAEHYPREAYGVAWDHLRALDRLRGEPPLRVLEIGCADGAFLELLRRAGHRAVGIDFSADAVALARSRGLDARLADAAGAAAFAGAERFTAIALFQVIEHLADPDGVFEAISAVAAPGALLFVGCPAPERYSRAVPHRDRVGDSDFWDWPPQHVLRWTPEGLSRFLDRHGWRVGRVIEEPFDAVGAAAHLAAIDGIAGGWYDRPARRRAATVVHRLRLGLARLRRRLTGTRMLAIAVRGDG
jgi:SAM-dependent methyltransferase